MSNDTTAFIWSDDTGHPDAAPFYSDAPEEPIAPSGTLLITDIVKLPKMNALGLLDAIIKAKPKRVLVVAHGSEIGIAIHLIPKHGASLRKEAIESLLDPSVSDAEASKICLIKEKEVAKLRDRIQQVHALALDRFELRACNTGGYTKTMEALRDFFGAAVAGGVMRKDAYTGVGDPVATKKEVSKFINNYTNAQVATMSGGDRVAYRIHDVVHNRFKFDWIADSKAALKNWMQTYIPSGTKVPPRALHGFMVGMSGSEWLEFPGDVDYRTELTST